MHNTAGEAVAGAATACRCRRSLPEPHFALQQAAAEPYCLLDAVSWQVCHQAVAELLTANQDFSVVGVLGAQGLGKSAFLNRLLGGWEEALIPL
jgi:hypothetical protein